MYNESMVYLNKIFTDIATRSCPLLTEFTANAETFTQQLSFYELAEQGCGCNDGDNNGCNNHGCGGQCGCGCGCGVSLEFNDDLTFVVEHTQVFISAFSLVEPEGLTVADVTVNGVPVDTLDYFNDRFMASANALMAQISDCKCMEKGMSTKGFLLIQNAGGWLARLTVVVQGIAFGCGGGKRFRLVMTSRENVPVSIPGTNTFAASSICLPCTVGGISPIINFSFSASASLLNPVITPDAGTDTCNVTLTGSLVTEPIANIQVTRQTLFTTTAAIVEQTCDGVPEPCEPASVNNCCCDHDRDTWDRCDDGNACDTCGSCQTCEPCEPVKPTQPRRPQISCQWNGCNGCGF